MGLIATSGYRRFFEAFNYRLRTLAGGRLASICRPTSIALLMTERCNARCIHCDIWKNRGQEDRPAFSEWKKVLSDLRQWLGPVHVVLTGGEALLNRDTIELVRYGGAIGLFIELLSHGYWEDQSKIRRLAEAHPGRVTVSFDGLSEIHNLIRGRLDFAGRTGDTIQTLRQMRQTDSLNFVIRLKTVIMRQNLAELGDIAWFARENGLEVLYQPIEQNYNTDEDPLWFQHSNTWPDDPERAIVAVKELCKLKEQGLPIANTRQQLEVMIPYFADPARSRVAVQSHSAHERRLLCSAMTMLQIQANGDVRPCASRAAIGNVKLNGVREIWETRPRWWQEGCCLEARLQ